MKHYATHIVRWLLLAMGISYLIACQSVSPVPKPTSFVGSLAQFGITSNGSTITVKNLIVSDKLTAVQNTTSTTHMTLSGAIQAATALITSTSRLVGAVQSLGAMTVHGLLTANGGLTTTGTVTTVDLVQTGALTRTGQAYKFPIAKVGATAGWVVNAAADYWQSTLPASQTSSTLIIPCTGLHTGDIITGGNIVGQVASVGGAFILEGELRRFTSAAAANVDASVGALTRTTGTANTVISSSNLATGTLAETVAADSTYYFRVIGTTAASVTMGIMGARLVITQK